MPLLRVIWGKGCLTGWDLLFIPVIFTPATTRNNEYFMEITSVHASMSNETLNYIRSPGDGMSLNYNLEAYI